MATTEEVLAKADAWEKAGKPENAAKLRAYAATLPKTETPKYDAATVEAKAAAWETAGKPENAAKLRAFAATLPAPEKPAVDVTARAKRQEADMVAAAPPAASPEYDAAMRADAFAKFEAANPSLQGRYTPDSFPKAGEVVMGQGGGGKSGGNRITVQGGNEGTFGDTAATMVEGPLAGARAFAGGLTGGESPSRDYLANDPLTGNLPGPVLTGLGAVGDLGGAGLSMVGAGIAGLTGLAAEAMPGQDAAGERKLAEDLTGMSMFAVPELAGASSIPARMATAAPKAAPAVAAMSNVEKGAAAAERLGIPVMRTDVKPPSTYVGKVFQKTGEAIPIAGTGGMRAKQQAAREAAVQDFITEYAGKTPAMKDLTDAVLAKHDADVTKLTRQKKSVIEKLPGAVETPAANAAIDAQIAKISRGTKEVADQVIPVLNQWKSDLVGKTLAEIELIRKQVGERFTALDNTAGRSTGEAAVSAIYGPLRNDMGSFIRSNGKVGDFGKWKKANDGLSNLMGEASTTALKSVLKKGEATPEVIGNMLFSQKPSDWARLKESLPPSAQVNARMAIIQRAMKSAANDASDVATISPQKFQTALEKLGPQARAFMGKDDLEATEGLIHALRLTKRGAEAGVSTNTGAQAVPIVIADFLAGVFGAPGGVVAGAAGIGGIARLYERTGVKTALRRLGKMQGPKAERAGIKMLEDALKQSGLPAATQSANAPLPMAVGQN